MIQFTQFLRPDGDKRSTLVSRGKDVEEKARRLKEAGLKLEAEILPTGVVSFTVFDPGTEEDIAIELSPNGPEVGDAVDRLIERAIKWLDERTMT